MRAIDLSKEQALDADAKATQQINFTGDLNLGLNVNVNTAMPFIIKGAKGTILDFLKGTVKVLLIYFTLIKYKYNMTQYNILNINCLIHNLLN